MKPWRVVRGAPRFLWQLVAGALRANESRAGAELRRWLYATSCHIDTLVHITNRRNFECGEGCALYHGTYVLNAYGRLVLGRCSHLGAFCFVNAQQGTVRIGDHVAIGPGTQLFAYSNHYAPGRLVTDERTTADITVGDNVFIGANCTLLPGTTIEDNVVVGAGTVVRGRLAGNAIYAGVPCREIRRGWFDPDAAAVTR